MQFFDAVFLVADPVEPDPQRIEHEFDHIAAMADPAQPQLRRRDPDFLARSGVAEIEPERPPDRQHVEAEKPSTGQAPISRKASPAAKLTRPMNAITTMKPVRLSERCGVSSAENNSPSGSGSKSLPAVIACQYTRIMAKSTRKPPSKSQATVPKRATSSKAASAATPKRNKSAKTAAAKPGAPRAAAKKTKPWTAAEVHEAFSRFRK